MKHFITAAGIFAAASLSAQWDNTISTELQETVIETTLPSDDAVVTYTNTFGYTTGTVEQEDFGDGSMSTTHYDQYGNPQGRAETITDIEGNRITYFMDAFGYPAGAVSESKDEYGKTILTYYDQYGNVVRIRRIR
tara:strand:- start:228 stop:635 length:408 start_codon:yes stop_codon:yes gene_type:complete